MDSTHSPMIGHDGGMERSLSGDGDRVPDDAELAAALGDDLGSELKDFAADGRGVVHDLSSARRKAFGQPPPVLAIPVVDVPSVLGRRVVCVNEHGPIYDRRAASEVFTDDSGSWIKVVEEWRW